VKHPVERADVKSRPKLDELDVKTLRLIAGGATNQAIAQENGVSTATTGRRLTALFEKMGAKDRTHATMIAVAARVIQVSDVALPTWVKVEMNALVEPLRVVVESPRVLDV
jgi:DNA-binding CsgD family transcriptional regulator